MSVDRKVRAAVPKLLVALNYAYSLRELEKMLNIPYQVLWRYMVLLTLPEKKTAELIMSRVSELNLLDKALRKAVEEASKNPYEVVRKPGFLALYSMHVREALGDQKIKTVFAVEPHDIILATALGKELNSEICPILSTYPMLRDYKLITFFEEGLKTAAIPNKCIKERAGHVLAAVALKNPDLLEALYAALHGSRGIFTAAAAVVSSRGVLEVAERRGIKIITLVPIT